MLPHRVGQRISPLRFPAWRRPTVVLRRPLTVLTGCDTYDDGRLEMKQYEGENYEMCTPEDIFLVKKNIEQEKKSATTDAEGRYTLETGRVEPGLDNKGLQIEDVDGEEHGGTFKKKFVRLNQGEAKQAEPGDGSWYMGKFAVRQDVSLEKE